MTPLLRTTDYPEGIFCIDEFPGIKIPHLTGYRGPVYVVRQIHCSAVNTAQANNSPVVIFDKNSAKRELFPVHPAVLAVGKCLDITAVSRNLDRRLSSRHPATWFMLLSKGRKGDTQHARR
ncbi:MAG: hypothetical protein PHD01_19015 [Geobacteraceae bacterium]|nr:hypothetical protein [Geobacteraceae bacterium]